MDHSRCAWSAERLPSDPQQHKNMKNESSTNGVAKTQNLNRRLAKHFAALAIPAIVVPAAHAGLVYSGPVNLNIPSNVDGVYLNVVTGVTGSLASSVTGWDINPYGSSSLSFFTPSSPATSFGVIMDFAGGSSATLVDNLPYGTSIGAGPTYGTGARSSETTGATAFLLNSSDNYVGFRFQNEADGNLVHYGWLHLSLAGGAGAQPRTILDYGYNDLAGEPIAAGVVPEPTSGALLMLGLAGIAGLRFRRK